VNNVKNIERVFKVVDRSLFSITGKLDYDRLTAAIIRLGKLVEAFDGDTEDIWYIGEMESCSLSDLIIGAYWHYAEWHAGQFSDGYMALSVLGQTFSAGMSDVEVDNVVYQQLNEMAEEAQS